MTKVWYTCWVMPHPGVENVTWGSSVSGCSGWSKSSGSVDVSRHAVDGVRMYAIVIPDRITAMAMTITMSRIVRGLRPPPREGVGPVGAPGGGWGEVSKVPSPARGTGVPDITVGIGGAPGGGARRSSRGLVVQRGGRGAAGRSEGGSAGRAARGGPRLFTGAPPRR